MTTLPEAFQTTVSVAPDSIALRTPGDGVSLSWRQYADEVRRIAGGLHAVGVAPGDNVALLLTNRPEFHLADTALLHLGAVPFSVYPTSSAEQLAWLLRHAEVSVVITERAFSAVVTAAGVPLEHTVTVETWSDLPAPDDAFDFDARWRAVEPGDIATLVYTSGTTADPKGVELTHANLLAEVDAITKVLPVAFGDRTISYLPTAHIADRIVGHYLSITHGVQVTDLADPTAVAKTLTDVRPTYFFGVPRIWEKIRTAIQPVVDSGADAAAIRGLLGLDELRWAISGAAAIAPETLRFFDDLGIVVCEVWGLTESCAGTTINPPDAIRVGTVGKPAPGVELKLADDGEVLLRGPMLTHGYRNDPERTAAAFDADGWFATGDIGTLDEDGYLRIVDRKKELIINAAGKNMSPAAIETAIRATTPVAAQVVVIGDGRPYNVALIVLDPDVACAIAHSAGRDVDDPAELAADPAVLGAVEKGVDAGNARLSRVEQIKKYAVLPDVWLPGGDELTPTMKLRRRPINDKYADRIEQIYADGSAR